MSRLPLPRSPGVYAAPPPPAVALAGVRLDVSAFVGVAPRGPARVPVVNENWPGDRPCVEPGRPRQRTVPVAVESFADYRRLYGGFEGPGLLPYAVSAFFDQGGRRAYVARVVHEYNDPARDAARVAAGAVPQARMTTGPFTLHARSEGSWGNRLRAAFAVTRQPLAFDPAGASAADLTLPADAALPAGAALHLALADGTTALRYVTAVTEEPLPDAPGTRLRATFDLPLAAAPAAAEVVEGALLIDDGVNPAEEHGELGLSSPHPRWLATVLCYESDLVYPDPAWRDAEVDLAALSDADLVALSRPPRLAPADPNDPQFAGGQDDYAAITPDDFFDPAWGPGDDAPRSGVHCLAQLTDLSLLVVPDLYSPQPLAPVESVLDPASLAGPAFARCLSPGPPQSQGVPPADLAGLRLDPRLPADRERIIALQLRLVELAGLLQAFVVLLDVPPGLSQRQILAWRARFSSAYAAAYHPWLLTAPAADPRGVLVRVPPAAAAAGIIAQSEAAFGVPHGPANVLVAGAVDVADAVSPGRQDALHPLGINLYLRERDGVRLTAARTLSGDPAYRQLSVRRLITLLRRTLQQKMQWVVFEPNNLALRNSLRQVLRRYLRQLYAAGAFAGDTEDQAFFVRCDATVNPPPGVEAGRLVVEVGVAPAEPTEFILVRLWANADGTLVTKE
jgi:hypothetical protein